MDASHLLNDSRASAVLQRMHGEADAQNWALVARLLPSMPAWLFGRALDWKRVGPRIGHLALAVDPASGAHLHLTTRALRAKIVVEYGSSIGMSAIYLGLAVRANGGGRVIGSELIPEKVARARANVEEAGLADIVEIRQGDARETLADVPGPIDFLHNDGWPGAMLEVTRLLAPRMRGGAHVHAGNVALFPADHVAYARWMRDPANGFRSARLAMKLGGEVSVREVDVELGPVSLDRD